MPTVKETPVASIRIGQYAQLRIFASNKAEMGVPLVELRGLDYCEHLTIGQAMEFAAGLIKAAAKASK